MVNPHTRPFILSAFLSGLAEVVYVDSHRPWMSSHGRRVIGQFVEILWSCSVLMKKPLRGNQQITNDEPLRPQGKANVRPLQDSR